MTADVLREAARLMRERAENSATAMVGPLTWTTNFNAQDSMTCLHYKNMTPDVPWPSPTGSTPGALVTEVSPHRHKGNALAVARAYLGDAS